MIRATDYPRVVLLSGGTGGAKLARGLQAVIGSNLTVIANTGDDIEIHGGYVSPDPDLIIFWLAGVIDERGWGLDQDTFHAMSTLKKLGDDVWFSLGDKDLAICLWRAKRLSEGHRLTQIIDDIRVRFEVRARVLPMCDQQIRTWIKTFSEWVPFQEFMIERLGQNQITADDNNHFDRLIEQVELRGLDNAAASPEVLDAISNANLIIIGPSNPIISIRPILSVPGIRSAIEESGAPVVAVSPIVKGSILKGPSDLFMRYDNQPLSSEGIVGSYDGILHGFVSDEACQDLPTLQTSVDMPDDNARQRLAVDTISFGLACQP